MAQAFQDLLVWHRAVDLSVAVYSATCSFPREEIYGLTSQMRRAAVSVASNIAEGRGRLSDGESRQFLGTAQGSNFEVQTQIVISRRLGLGTEIGLGQAESLSIEVGKMVSSLIMSIPQKLKANS